MIKKLYNWFLRLTSAPGEKDEYSRGYLQNRVRKEVIVLCHNVKGRLLEIGCGEGLFLAQVAGQNSKLEMWGVDIDDVRLEAAALRLRNVNLSCQDAVKLSFEDGYFDAVICINVLLNMRSLEDVRNVIKEMRRVCKREGSVIFDFRNFQNPFMRIKYHLAGYYDDTLKNLPLSAYSLEEIEAILKDLRMEVAVKKFIGFNSRIFSAAVIVEAKTPC